MVHSVLSAVSLTANAYLCFCTDFLLCLLLSAPFEFIKNLIILYHGNEQLPEGYCCERSLNNFILCDVMNYNTFILKS